MNHKKLLLLLFFGICLTTQSFSRDIPLKVNPLPSEPTARVEQLENRLEEINAMDLQSKSRAEKKELRKEVRSIEREMKTMERGGLYISIGSLIIIILLLIILL